MYACIFVAGTFDGLHKGHREMLQRALDSGSRVIVGVTTDAFVEIFKMNNVQDRIENVNHNIQTFIERRKRIEDWLISNAKQKNWEIMPIDDPLEPLASMTDVDAVVVSTETKVRGEKINAIRKDRGLSSLPLLVVPVIPAEDGKPMSSTRVRKGEVDRDGRLIMPESLRGELSLPVGRVLRDKEIVDSFHTHEYKVIIAVGDKTTKTLLDAGIVPSLSIVDGYVMRKPYKDLEQFLIKMKEHTLYVQSGPGYMSNNAILEIQRIIGREGKHVLVVDGEEDLLALPVIVYAPIGSVVFYGQPRNAVSVLGKPQTVSVLGKPQTVSVLGKPQTVSVLGKPHGIVEVIVTHDIKKRIAMFMSQFTFIT